MKNPHYEKILEDKDFKQRCFESDPEGYQILFSEDAHIATPDIHAQNSEDIDQNDL